MLPVLMCSKPSCYRAGHPLAALTNTVLTPHIAAGTWDSFVGKMDSVLSNIAAFFDGRPLQNEIVLATEKVLS